MIKVLICITLLSGCTLTHQHKDTILVEYLENRVHWEIAQNPAVVKHCVKLYERDALLCSRLPIEQFIKNIEEEEIL